MKTNVFPATVTNVDDPLKVGRVKVKCPGLVRSDRELPYWLAPSFPFVSSKAAGWFFPPDVGDQVEIEVTDAAKSDEIGGESSISAPNARYRAYLYNDAQQLPDEFKENYPKRRGVKTPGGTILLFDDTEDSEQSLWQDKYGNVILMTKTGVRIYNDNGSYLEIVKSGGTTTLRASGMLKIELDGSVAIARHNDLVIPDTNMIAWMTTLTAAINAILGPGTLVFPTDFGKVVASSTKMTGG